MLAEEPKRTVSMRPITLLVCFVCLIGLSVPTTYLVDRAKYKKLSDSKDQSILATQKNIKSLSDQNIELQNSLQKLQDEYGSLESQHKDLAVKLDIAKLENAQTASELASALKDLETARAGALELKGELDADASKIEALNADRQALEQKYIGFKDLLASSLILEPTWVVSGETTLAFDGSLIIVLYEASDTSKCPKDSAAFSYLIRGTDKMQLCLRTGKPESFTYQGKKYLLTLLESKQSEGTHHYCISILKER
jgi:hypothetical protein